MIRKMSLVIAIALLMAAAAPAKDHWVKLFNGKSLKGWSVHSGTATYKAEHGVIVGTAVLGSPNSFLCTDKEFGDFILEFEVKVDAEMNSGVQIRSEIAKEPRVFKATTPAGKEVERKTPPDRVYGYQVEIADGTGNAGNIYDEARRARFLDDWANKPEAKKAFQSGEWNKFRVEARGDSLKTWVNGIACAGIHDSMTARGIIGLQVHQVPKDKFKPYQVRFRNVRLQELK